MKKTFFVVFAIACAMFFASCGGGSTGGGKKLAKNDFLGDLPNLVYQKHLTDSIRNAEEKLEGNKLDPNKKGDWKKATEIAEKFKIRRKTEDESFKTDCEKLKPELIGKEIPFETEENTGYEVTYCKISDVEKGSVYVDFEVRITNTNAAKIIKYGKPQIIVTVQNIKQDGNKLSSDGAYYVELSGRENGATGRSKRIIAISAEKAEEYVNFAKLRFVKTK